MSRNVCPQCKNMLVSANGPLDSKILLLGGKPDFEDQKTGVAMSGTTREMLTSELAKVGLQFSSIRVAFIWQHMENKECAIEWHIDKAMKEIKGKTHVLLMGSDATRTVLNKNAGDIGGLVMTSKMFPNVKFVAAPSQSEMFNSGVGEMRFSLDTFSKLIKK